MFTIRKPNAEQIARFLDRKAGLPFTYESVGATADQPPEDFLVDHTRLKIGKGELVFEQAKLALQRWEQFQLRWVDAAPADVPIEVGQLVAILGRAYGLWSVNACRIVYVVDEAYPLPRFGFAYGTLPGHIASGEERFLVEMNDDGGVWFDILAFSKPHHLLARLGYPLMRRKQKRFGQQSAASMLRAVELASVPVR